MDFSTDTRLTAPEQELVCNQEWIFAKLAVIEKVYRLFGGLALVMQREVEELTAVLPPEVKESSPKISRGENYRNLPYVMLDYPRHFTKTTTLAIRTLFWWGNFFSIHLQLAGACRDVAMPAMLNNFELLKSGGYWICINADPWEHHFEVDNYVRVDSLSASEFADMLKGALFIKIARKIPLSEWAKAPGFLADSFRQLLGLLGTNYQAGEKDPSPGIPIVGSGL